MSRGLADNLRQKLISMEEPRRGKPALLLSTQAECASNPSVSRCGVKA